MMRCPFCRQTDTQVLETRMAEDAAVIKRRRRCTACDKRFTTYERAELVLPVVVKKDGSRVDFDRKKLIASMVLSLRKRPVSSEQIDTAVARIEYQLLASGEREVNTQELGRFVMNELRQLDQVAYVRFASVYRQFQDLSEFQLVLEELKNASSK